MLTVPIGGWVKNVGMLTVAYVGGWVGGFGKILCLRNMWMTPKVTGNIYPHY